MAYRTPTYNLKAAVQKTGVKPETLRAWERRYGLPDPGRTSGGHRLYSPRDIDVVRWLVARQAEGLSIKRAVELWNSMDEGGQDPLHMMQAAPQASVTVGETIVELREAWIAASLAFDEREAEQTLTQAFALYPPETVCLEIISKGLAELGEGWYAGDVTVQQEHFATTLATRRIEALTASVPPPNRSGRILLACPPQEDHCFSLALLTFLLRRQGWDILYLGANVPVAEMESAIETSRLRWVILAAQRLPAAATLAEMAQFLQDRGVPVAFGGRVFNVIPALRSRIPGRFLAERLDQAPLEVEQMMAVGFPTPQVEPPSAAYRAALERFQERHLAIELDVSKALGSAVDYRDQERAHRELGANIVAALTLGDIDFLGADMIWLEGMLGRDAAAAAALGRYLDAYAEAARVHLGEKGAPIVRWLEEWSGAAALGEG